MGSNDWFGRRLFALHLSVFAGLLFPFVGVAGGGVALRSIYFSCAQPSDIYLRIENRGRSKDFYVDASGFYSSIESFYFYGNRKISQVDVLLPLALRYIKQYAIRPGEAKVVKIALSPYIPAELPVSARGVLVVVRRKNRDGGRDGPNYMALYYPRNTSFFSRRLEACPIVVSG